MGAPYASPSAVIAIISRVSCLILILLTGCAMMPSQATVEQPAASVPLAAPASAPVAMPVGPASAPAAAPASAPAASAAQPPLVSPPIKVAPAKPTIPAWQDPIQGRTLVDKLLPPGIKHRREWQADIFDAFAAMKIPYTAEYFCGAMAVIEQESSWQGDPVVPGLGQAVWKELQIRANKYDIPLPLVKLILQRKSANGKSYAARIDALKTEREMNALFEELIADGQNIGLKFSIANPIRTGGPMQVSVDFAEQQMRAWPYPYPVTDTVRHMVFSQRGGVYFGIAHLLQYRAPYTRMLYRFADFNAGRYSSRNAALQMAVGKLSRRKLDRDGDLLRYNGDVASSQTSATQLALYHIAGKLGLSRAAIDHDLAQEKTETFVNTALYRRIYQLVDKPGHPWPRETLPQIRLVSTKITRKLTTAWFAERVNGRFERCMQRQ